MYNSFQLAKKYLHYYLSASNSKGHGMHSPFVFDFILNVLNNTSGYRYPDDIEELRKSLCKDERVIEVQDHGAGSRHGSANRKSIASLARTAVKPKKYAQLIYRLVKHYKPDTIVELGTSLGITTAYISKANSSASIITVEGSKNIQIIANENFNQLDCRNIQSIHGNFDDVLPTVIPQLSSPVSMVYIDGNHRYEPTIRYFKDFLSKINEDTIMIFDDIHWSAEMENAWREIKADHNVQYSIDIFFMGFVFFRREFKVKQDFIIRF